MVLKTVKTVYGAVKGVLSDRRDVILYKGIPIGADTALENRFREPRPAAHWEGVRMCDRWPDRFLQEPHAVMDTGQKERDLHHRQWLMKYCGENAGG